jgi:Domain of unknown function (DUF4357)
MIKESIDREDLKNVGVYLLFGKDPNSPEHDMVYIGETEDGFTRLNNHIKEKEFWTNVVVIISKDGNLNKAHVRYLEYKLYELAKKIGRFRLANKIIPRCPSISESDTAEMDEFTENIKLLVNTLGYKVFEDVSTQETAENDTFFLRSSRGAEAKGKRTSEGFVVFKNSIIAQDTVVSAQKWILDLRKQLLEQNYIIQDEEYLILTKDYLFSSPSAAAAVILGRSANGLTEWKLENGLSLKEVESEN